MEIEMKQTAVEWLGENMGFLIPSDKELLAIQIINQAKEMEKQQIIDSYIECKRQYIIQESCFPPQFVVKEAEQYYNKRFKNK